jgi:hypothetical protein
MTALPKSARDALLMHVYLLVDEEYGNAEYHVKKNSLINLLNHESTCDDVFCAIGEMYFEGMPVDLANKLFWLTQAVTAVIAIANFWAPDTEVSNH